VTENVQQETLEAQVGAWLLRRGFLLASAESCTGGLVGHRLTDVPGSSAYYLGGITAYSNQAKQRLLGIRTDTLLNYGAVSEAVALEMARGVRQALSSDFPLAQLIGVSVTGIAGPGGSTAEKPVGLTWIGISAAGFERAWRFVWEGDRIDNKQQSAEQALRLLLDFLQEKVME
jgi:PncC family amidohydrolase